MNTEKSYYDIMEISKNFTPEELNKQKKKLAKKYHPDKLPPEKKDWGTERFKEVCEAYEVLSDPNKRHIYDTMGKEGLNNQPKNDFFQFNPFTKFQQKTEKVKPIYHKIDITLETSYFGQEVECDIIRLSLCKNCNSTGFADKQKHFCKTCNGNKTIFQTVQLGPGIIQQVQQICGDCKGTGLNKNNDKCKVCFGRATTHETCKIKIKIEIGSMDKDQLVFENEGNEYEINGQIKRGPIVFILNEVEHPIFKKGVSIQNTINPTNLKIDLEIELYEALCGFSREIKHFNKTIFFTSSNIIKDNDIKIILNYGMPYKGSTYKFGDLFIRFKVKYPNKITNIKSVYELLSGKEYNENHQQPENVNNVDLIDPSSYTHDPYEEKRNPKENVQCTHQ